MNNDIKTIIHRIASGFYPPQTPTFGSGDINEASRQALEQDLLSLAQSIIDLNIIEQEQNGRNRLHNNSGVEMENER